MLTPADDSVLRNCNVFKRIKLLRQWLKGEQERREAFSTQAMRKGWLQPISLLDYVPPFRCSLFLPPPWRTAARLRYELEMQMLDNDGTEQWLKERQERSEEFMRSMERREAEEQAARRAARIVALKRPPHPKPKHAVRRQPEATEATKRPIEDDRDDWPTILIPGTPTETRTQEPTFKSGGGSFGSAGATGSWGVSSSKETTSDSSSSTCGSNNSSSSND